MKNWDRLKAKMMTVPLRSVGAALVLNCFAIFILGAIGQTRLASAFKGGEAMLRRHWWFGVAGILLFLLVRQIGAARLLRNSTWLLGVSALAVASGWYFPPGYGMHRWIRIGDISLQPMAFAAFATIVFAVAHAGCRSRWPAVAVGGIIFLIFATASPFAALLLGLVIAVLLPFIAGDSRKWFRLAGYGGLVAGLAVLSFVYTPLRWARWTAFLTPERDQERWNYWLACSIHAIRSAGWWSGNPSAFHRNFPGFRGQLVLPALAVAEGRLYAVLIVVLLLTAGVLAAVLVSRMETVEQRRLTAGLTALILLPAYYNVLMVIGGAPMVDVALPLVSFGGSSILMAAAVLGAVSSLGSEVAVRVKPEERMRR